MEKFWFFKTKCNCKDCRENKSCNGAAVKESEIENFLKYCKDIGCEIISREEISKELYKYIIAINCKVFKKSIINEYLQESNRKIKISDCNDQVSKLLDYILNDNDKKNFNMSELRLTKEQIENIRDKSIKTFGESSINILKEVYSTLNNYEDTKELLNSMINHIINNGTINDIPDETKDIFNNLYLYKNFNFDKN
jgi:hypothetical protein